MRGDDPLLAAIVARVAAAWDVPAGEMRARRRGSRHTVQARQVAIYLAVVGLERMRTDIAPWFRRHPSVIGHAVRVVEDRRDDPGFDAAVTELEAWLAGRDSADAQVIASLRSQSRLCASVGPSP